MIKISTDIEPLAVCEDYCRTVEENIKFFLKDKSQWLLVQLENAQQDFAHFWDRIGAEGDKEAAMAEFNNMHNASKGQASAQKSSAPRPYTAIHARFRRLLQRTKSKLW